MLQDIAYGGTQGDALFQQVCQISIQHPRTDHESSSHTLPQTIAASPYLPQQYGYADWIPTQSYFALAQKVGCFTGEPYGDALGATIFECLVGKDTLILQQVSAIVSGSALFADWSFLPVTDGLFLQQLPSQQLLKQQVNGRRIMTGVKLLHLSSVHSF